ncbi:GNAT family N-acetyltransferase [Neobacillus drentensis]|uniref:GNAT family N-acetyltransferase n=1 Tax=Neobacillus drentensis TaxID=220684 RepID=UPI000826CE98|nr:GNAT family N-acetyltransferase [Neobacillus drentensis]
MYFEVVKKETLYIALEMINSNRKYNIFENGIEARTLADMEEEFLNPNSISAFIKLDDTYIGIIDYLLENPKDHYPWLGLLLLHSDYQGYGFGAQAFAIYESEMLERGEKSIRLGVLKENVKAKRFWESLGFTYYNTATTQKGSGIFCYQKQIG